MFDAVVWMVGVVDLGDEFALSYLSYLHITSSGTVRRQFPGGGDCVGWILLLFPSSSSPLVPCDMLFCLILSALGPESATICPFAVL